MCQRYTTEVLSLQNGKKADIDKCIYGLVKMFNENGMETVASCCGHGIRPGNIALRDGREFIIAKDYEEGRKIDRLYPPLSTM